jgi:nitroreductase
MTSAAAAYVALRPHAAWAKRAARATTPLQPWRLTTEPPANPFDLARALIGAAVLAPSHWNTQPWRFEVDGASIRIVADVARALPALDPDRRSMMMALGAALENMLVAARAYGLQPTVTHFPHQGANGVVAELAWTAGGERRDRPMFLAVAERRTNRRTFDGRGIYMQNRGQLLAQMFEGCTLHWIDDRQRIRELGELVHDAVREQTLDPRMQAERLHWMRRDDGDSERRGDGVSRDALELGGPAKWFTGLYFKPTSRFLGWGAESVAKQARERVRSSGALALLAAPRADEAQWLEGGQAFQRFALKATQLGIAHQPISAPIEMPAHRAELVRRFGATGEEPMLLVRLGHARRPDATPRRAATLVSSVRNS